MPIDWAEQLSLHRRWLQTVIQCRLGRCADIDDILQDVAIAVLPHANPPTDVEKVAPWLYRITLRKIINLRRGDGRRRRMIERFSSLHGDALAHDQHPTAQPVSWLIQQETAETVRAAIERLPAGEQEILMLKYTEHWTYAQLSQHLGVTEKTVEYRLLKARKGLAQQLSPQANP